MIRHFNMYIKCLDEMASNRGEKRKLTSPENLEEEEAKEEKPKAEILNAEDKKLVKTLKLLNKKVSLAF